MTAMKLQGICLVAAILAGPACKDEPGSYEQGGEPPPKVVKTESVQVVKAPVEWGKKVPCTTFMPDAAKWSAAVGKEVVIADNSRSDAEAASVCQLKLAGTRVTPAAATELRTALPGCEVVR